MRWIDRFPAMSENDRFFERFVLGTSGRTHTLHLELGAATWTPEHAGVVDTADVLAAIEETEALALDPTADRLRETDTVDLYKLVTATTS